MLASIIRGCLITICFYLFCAIGAAVAIKVKDLTAEQKTIYDVFKDQPKVQTYLLNHPYAFQYFQDNPYVLNSFKTNELKRRTLAADPDGILDDELEPYAKKVIKQNAEPGVPNPIKSCYLECTRFTCTGQKYLSTFARCVRDCKPDQIKNCIDVALKDPNNKDDAVRELAKRGYQDLIPNGMRNQ